MIARVRRALRRFLTSSGGVWLLPLEGGVVAIPGSLAAHVRAKPETWVYARDQAEAERLYQHILAELDRLT